MSPKDEKSKKKANDKKSDEEAKQAKKSVETSPNRASEEKKPEKSEKQDTSEEDEKKQKLESFRKAGEIHRKVVEYIKPKIKVGVKYLTICEQIEDKIIELGGDIGFPVNISVNNVACHYTSAPDDENEIKEGDIVKIDIGVAVDGYTADGAFTVSFNDDPKINNLITAVETAVSKGLSEIKAGVKLNRIGKITSKIIREFGYRPIRELSGHLIEQWVVHAGKEIPNIALPTEGTAEFKEGEVYALECFATTGKGTLHRSNQCNIFALNPGAARVPIRNKTTRKILGWISANRKTLPFSTRQLQKEFKNYKFALQELRRSDKLIEHYVLKEDMDGAYIAQYEHTFIVTADGIEKIT